MGVDRKDFSDAANWQIPRELPDLRRVGIISLDTETNDEGLRADRGSAWPWRDGYVCGISVAWRDGRRDPRDLHSDAPSRHRQFRSRPGLPLAQGPDRGRRALRHHERSLRLGLAAHRWRHPDAAIRSARRGRRARGHGRREPAQIQPRRTSANATACPARTRRCWRKRARRPASRSARRLQCQILHLATAGALCRPLRRDRCGANARSCTRCSSRSSSGKGRATPIGWKSTCCRWCMRCAAAASASTRTPPSRPTICCIGKRDAALTELSDQHGAAVSMAEISGTQMAGKDLRRLRHQLSAHRERQSIVLDQEIGMDGRTRALAAARDRGREANTITQAKRLSEDTSSTTS